MKVISWHWSKVIYISKLKLALLKSHCAFFNQIVAFRFKEVNMYEYDIMSKIAAISKYGMVETL